METKHNYFLAGVFMILGLVAMSAFGIWLAGNKDDTSYKPFHIFFTDSVNGLSTGGAVKYRGVDVGRIKKVQIDPTNMERIMVTVMIAENTPLKTDTIAVQKSQGITGIGYIDLSGGSKDAPTLQAAAGKMIPEIPSRQSQLDQLVTSLPEMVNKYSALAGRLNKLVSNENVQSFSATLQSLDSIANTLDSNSSSLDKMLKEMTATIVQVSTATETLNGITKATREDAIKSMRETRQALESLNTLLSRTNNFSEYGYQELYRMMLEVKKTSRELQDTSKNLKENPSRLILPAKESGVVTP